MSETVRAAARCRHPIIQQFGTMCFEESGLQCGMQPDNARFLARKVPYFVATNTICSPSPRRRRSQTFPADDESCDSPRSVRTLGNSLYEVLCSPDLESAQEVTTVEGSFSQSPTDAVCVVLLVNASAEAEASSQVEVHLDIVAKDQMALDPPSFFHQDSFGCFKSAFGPSVYQTFAVFPNDVVSADSHLPSSEEFFEALTRLPADHPWLSGWQQDYNFPENLQQRGAKQSCRRSLWHPKYCFEQCTDVNRGSSDQYALEECATKGSRVYTRTNNRNKRRAVCSSPTRHVVQTPCVDLVASDRDSNDGHSGTQKQCQTQAKSYLCAAKTPPTVRTSTSPANGSEVVTSLDYKAAALKGATKITASLKTEKAVLEEKTSNAPKVLSVCWAAVVSGDAAV